MTKCLPIVSVIIPTYNRAKEIGRAIDSVLNQTIENVEVIVVDDASTDSTKNVVQGYVDSRVRYVKHETNQFAAAARNTGMRLAQGEYIAFLDSDDEWLPKKLEVQVSMLEGYDADWGCIYSGAYIYKNGGNNVVEYRPSKYGIVIREYLISQIVIWTPTFLFRRNCLKNVGYMDTSLVRGQDRDFYIRMLERYKMAVIEEPLANIFLDTKKPLADTALRSRLLLLKKHDALLEGLGRMTKRRAYGMQWILQAEQYFVEKEQMKGLVYTFKSLVNYPFLAPKRYLVLAFKFTMSLIPR